MGEGAEPSRILDHLFLGSKAHARNKELLQCLHITHILNVTPPKTTDPVAGVPNFFEKDKVFIYRRCPVFDNKAEDISSVLEGCIAFIDQAKFYGRILVHCNKGVSRSTSMVVAYLMKLHSMSFEQAMVFVIERRSIANPNAGFRRQLEEYGRRLKRARPTEKRVRVARGPVGPSLPPSAPDKSAKASSAAIGPQLPPHLARGPQMPSGSEAADEKAEKTQEKPEKVVIGPSRPPSAKRRRAEAEEDDNANVEEKRSGDSSPQKKAARVNQN